MRKPSLFCALFLGLVSSAFSQRVEVTWTFSSPEVGDFSSLLKETGAELTVETDLVIRGKVGFGVSEKADVTCANLTMLEDRSTGREIAPGLYLQTSTLQVAKDVVVERGMLGIQRGKLTWGERMLLGYPGKSGLGSLEFIVASSELDGKDLIVSSNGALAVRFFDNVGVNALAKTEEPLIRLAGMLELKAGAQIHLRFDDQAFAAGEAISAGSYPLLEAAGGIDGMVPMLAAYHGTEPVDASRFSLKIDGSKLILEVVN